MPYEERLSPHFTLNELIRSARAIKLGIDNTPPEAFAANALVLAELLENARSILTRAFGREVRIIPSSGYRCLALNEAVGGSGSKPGEKLSAHCEFRACDFHPDGISIKLAFDALRAVHFGWDKLILETDGKTTWIHIQVPRMGQQPRYIVLTGQKGPEGSTFKAA